MLQHETIPQITPLVRQDISAGCASEAVSTSIEVNAGEQAQSVFDASLTPQEFARAIALVEARREVRRRPKPDAPTTRTLLTDSASNVITVDASMEELRAEVQAHRAIKHQDVAMTARKRKELSWWLLLGGFLLSSAAVVGLTLLMYVLVRQDNKLLTDNLKMGRALFALQLTQANIPTQRLLSQVADNTPVHVRYGDLAALSRGKLSPAQIQVTSTAGTNITGTPPWTLLKYEGRYFVLGWRYTGKGGYKDHKDWFASIASRMDVQESSFIPIECFKNLTEPPSIVQDGAGEQVYLPDTP